VVPVYPVGLTVQLRQERGDDADQLAASDSGRSTIVSGADESDLCTPLTSVIFMLAPRTGLILAIDSRSSIGVGFPLETNRTKSTESRSEMDILVNERSRSLRQELRWRLTDGRLQVVGILNQVFESVFGDQDQIL